MSQRKGRGVMDRNEQRLINALRNYYADQFKNGPSDESFLIWLEGRLTEMREIYDDQPWENRPRWLQSDYARNQPRGTPG